MYADYEYYKTTYGGSMTEDNYNIFGKRASAFMDFITERKLIDNLPSDEDDLDKIRECCCVLAEEMLAIRTRKDELASSSSGGIVKSMSSGGESVTYELSELDTAILEGEVSIRKYLYGHAKMYLSYVADDDGSYYLYWGI